MACPTRRRWGVVVVVFSRPCGQTGCPLLCRSGCGFFLSLGAAGSEDVHPFPRDELSALEAISIIGGVSDNRANPKGILVLRDYPASMVRPDGSGPPHERVVFTLDLTSADGLFSAGQFPIMSGDLVYATESRLTSAQTVLSILGNTLGLANQTLELNE